VRVVRYRLRNKFHKSIKLTRNETFSVEPAAGHILHKFLGCHVSVIKLY